MREIKEKREIREGYLTFDETEDLVTKRCSGKISLSDIREPNQAE